MHVCILYVRLRRRLAGHFQLARYLITGKRAPRDVLYSLNNLPPSLLADEMACNGGRRWLAKGIAVCQRRDANAADSRDAS